MPPETTERVTNADDLTESDEKILDELRKGARTKGALVDGTGLHRNTVGHRLEVLDASGIINEVHDSTALYELVRDPRDDEKERHDLYQPGKGHVQTVDGAEKIDVESLRGQAVDLEKLDECLSRALSELPEGTPGRTNVEDAHRIVEEAIDNGE